MNTATRLGIVLLSIATGNLLAEDGFRGHWTGSFQRPDREIAVEIDLDKSATGWKGTMSFLAQKATVELEQITVADGKGSFRLEGPAGDPTFNAKLSEDGKTMSGNFTQGTVSYPFKFTRAGDPKFETEKTSPPLSKEFLGDWQGSLQAERSLRLAVKFWNYQGGAKGTLTSIDQGNFELSVTTISQKESKLIFTVSMVGGQYEGTMNKEGTEITGTWSQLGNNLPLVFRRAGVESKKP